MPRPSFDNDLFDLPASFVEARADYQAAKQSRFRRKRTGISSLGSNADYHYRSEADYLRILEYSRDMYRNDAIISQGVDRSVCETIQGGIAPDPNTGNKRVDKILKRRWADWSPDPRLVDASGIYDWPSMQQLGFRSLLVDGDIFALPFTSGRLGVVEAHRVRTPRTRRNVVHGILLGPNRRRLQYWVTKEDLDPRFPINRVSDMHQFDAWDAMGNPLVYHLYNPKRYSQTRGVSALAPVFDTAGMFEDINFANLVRAQVASCFAFIRKSHQSGPPLAGVGAQLGPQETTTHSDGSTKTIEGLAPGMMIRGRPGEEFEGFSPNVPNPEFFDHVKLMLSIIGVNLGLPRNLLMMDASDTNFSGFRGATDAARRVFKSHQETMVRHWCRPVWEWKVRQWIEEEPLLRQMRGSERVDLFGVQWNFPRWNYIDPVKDSASDKVRVTHALTSRRRLHRERDSVDWDDMVREIAEDNAALITACIESADRINAAHEGAEVTWQDVMSPPLDRKAASGKMEQQQTSRDEQTTGRQTGDVSTSRNGAS